MSFIPAILSGGSGTRLWPLSRTQFPKQFCELFEESLFQKTLRRLLPIGSPWVVTNAKMRILTERTLRDSGISLSQALYEPKAANTAPAIALLCRVLESRGHGDSIAGIFPSDHLIQNESTFRSAIELGIECAKKGQVVTLGIQPTYPATGYGYIEVGSGAFAEGSGLRALPTRGFREKPAEQTAREFIASGNFYWNGGMFLFRVSTMINHLRTLMPELWNVMSGLKDDLSNLVEIYDRCPSQSIDYGVMEKLKEQVCIPCDLGWSDVGSWTEIAKLRESTEKIEVSSSGNFALSNTGRLVSFVGTENLVVIDTADAILVADKESTQNVKQVVDALNERKDKRAHEHPFEYRPWGRFEVLRDTTEFKSKVIHVNPGQQLSYQSHAKRAEHWVIVRGNPEVVLNDVVHALKPGESIYIPQGAKHRIRNPHASETVEFVEVQVGTYFGEDDIIRYQDDYKRV
jgi:mannose-1-phosphate guanylyltransferase/mannose-6-phosphate isomerase